uniref:Uncharacterized protein n=2 Tax=Drosophila melanogaster TaxID=7227 RepID=M9NF55_DROME|eukprot:NP_001245677.1 uncharacterized protein Dmel_CG43075 [Drosophila melanogaster]
MTIYEQISDQFCRVVHTNLKIPLSYCETRSHWKFSKSIDTMIFFYTLSFGILRVILHFIDLVNIYFRGMRLRRPSNLLILRGENSRGFRVLKHLLMLKAWILVIYGMVFIKPHYINPFVVLSIIILTIDVFVLVLDILRKARIPLDRRVTLWEMMLNLCCVFYVQWILKQQIQY